MPVTTRSMKLSPQVQFESEAPVTQRKEKSCSFMDKVKSVANSIFAMLKAFCYEVCALPARTFKCISEFVKKGANFAFEILGELFFAAVAAADPSPFRAFG